MSDLSRFVANKLSGEWSASNVSGVLTDVIIEVGAGLGCGLSSGDGGRCCVCAAHALASRSLFRSLPKPWIVASPS